MQVQCARVLTFTSTRTRLQNTDVRAANPPHRRVRTSSAALTRGNSQRFRRRRPVAASRQVRHPFRAAEPSQGRARVIVTRAHCVPRARVRYNTSIDVCIVSLSARASVFTFAAASAVTFNCHRPCPTRTRTRARRYTYKSAHARTHASPSNPRVRMPNRVVM